MKKDEKKCNELQDKIVPKYTLVSYVIFFLWFLLCAVTIYCNKEYSWLIKKLQQLNISFSWLLGNDGLNNFLIIVKSSSSHMYNYISVSCTIVAAIVVLYYTLQDTHREGIPHRKIVAYSVGSAAIPVAFFIQLIMVGIMTVFMNPEQYILLVGFSVSTFILQIFILVTIILSSTSVFCRKRIKKTEYTQFCYLMKYTIDNKDYVWNYFVHHMPQVLAGDDMIYDKAITFHSLLSIPLDYKKRNERCDSQKWKTITYEYYFRNIVMSFEQLMQSKEDSNQIFETIYEFIADLINDKGIEAEGKLLVLSAIMNAALTSGILRAEAFCCHILNCFDCKKDAEFRHKLIFLYLLFLDHLYRTESEKVCLQELITIDGICDLNFVQEDIYAEFWCIWTTQSDLPWESSIVYLMMALDGLYGTKGTSSVMDFYYYTVARIREKRYVN